MVKYEDLGFVLVSWSRSRSYLVREEEKLNHKWGQI